MNKEEGIKLNNAFDEFCQNFNIKSALAYFATADGESVALAFHNVGCMKNDESIHTI